MTDRPTLERLQEWSEVLDDSSYYEILGVLDANKPGEMRLQCREVVS